MWWGGVGRRKNKIDAFPARCLSLRSSQLLTSEEGLAVEDLVGEVHVRQDLRREEEHPCQIRD